MNHDERLEVMLQKCREKGIQLIKEEVELEQTEITYLGHVLLREGRKPDPERIAAVQQLPTPESNQDVQRSLGVVGYLQKFAPILSEEATPLRELLNKNVHFTWDPDVQGTALEKLKKPS